MSNSKPALDDLQAAPDDSAEKKFRTQHTRRVFAWLDNVVADKKVKSSGFRVAYVIAQHWNAKTGVAYPSTETIASECGLAASTVRTMVNNLMDQGHLDVKFGSPGRGHPNVYRPIIKERAVAVLELVTIPTRVAMDHAAKERLERSKERSDAVKPRRVAMNHLTTATTERAASPPALADRVESASDVTDGEKALAYGELLRHYPKYLPDGLDHHCRDTFYGLLDDGTYAESIIDGAADYADRCQGVDPKLIRPLAHFLRVKGWEWGNDHLM